MVVREFLRIQDFLIYRDGFLFKDWCQYVINMSLCWGTVLKKRHCFAICDLQSKLWSLLI